MKVIVQLNQDQIIEAIRFYLEAHGTPTDPDNNAKPFEIKLSMHGEQIQTPGLLTAEMRFEAKHFTQGPYR